MSACTVVGPESVSADFISLRASFGEEIAQTKSYTSADAYTATSPSADHPLHSDVWFSTTAGTYPGAGGVSADRSTMDVHSSIRFESGAFTFPQEYQSHLLQYPAGDNTVYCVGFWPKDTWEVNGDGTKACFKSAVNVDGETDFMFAPQISGSKTSPFDIQNYKHIQTWIKVRVRAQTADAPITWGNIKSISIDSKGKPTVDLQSGEVTFSDDPDDAVQILAFSSDEGQSFSTESVELGSVFVSPMTGTDANPATLKFHITTDEWEDKEVDVELLDNQGSKVIDTTEGKLYVVTLSFKTLSTIDASATLTSWVDEPREVTAGEKIYFDLAAGNVSIGTSTYEGKVYVNGNATTVSGTHVSSNRYYVYQSTGDTSGDYDKSHTGYASTSDFNSRSNCRIPNYPGVTYGTQSWADYITNNSNVQNVTTNWTTAVAATGRTSTANYITVNGAVGKCDLTIDNLYSTYEDASTSRTTSGICFIPGTNTSKTLVIRLKGDNRFGAITYGSTRDSNNLRLTSFDGDGNTSGSITCADIVESNHANYYNAVIGGTDNTNDDACGIVINGGTVFAGSYSEDRCTAIGGGGNGPGSITINGGRVTAVSASSGTAIGGGVGGSSAGGKGTVTINGGYVYAYNHQNYFNVPAVAIGGGSSDGNLGKDGNVTITGGNVYAQCYSGPAIGGGSSNLASGTNAKGGKAVVNISGNPVITTGSIGGGIGKANPGCTTVTVSGGTIHGQFVLAAGSGFAPSFNMTGGTISGSSTTDPTYAKMKNDGGAIFIAEGTCTITGGTITGCSAVNGGGIAAEAASGKTLKVTIGTASGSQSNPRIESNTASGNGANLYATGSGTTVSILSGNVPNPYYGSGVNHN